jgi:hypothetical protein
MIKCMRFNNRAIIIQRIWQADATIQRTRQAQYAGFLHLTYLIVNVTFIKCNNYYKRSQD